ncbi:MAG: TauD/TfdA family dioxygenase [Planctomycetota bacterium]|nr:TauD/TfdA family dioxygenase [Planctomycetota bacterium]
MKVSPPNSGKIGAVVEQVRIPDLTSSELTELKELVYRHKLVVLRDVELSDAEYVAWGYRMGKPQRYFQDHYHHPEHPEIFVSSNIPVDGNKVGVSATGRFWPSDYQFFDEPLSLTSVFPKVIPEGPRSTLFVDMVAALERLPSHLRKSLEGRRCFHEAVMYYKIQPADMDRAIAELMEEFRQLSPGARHPAIITHPVTGQQALYISRGFTMKVDGYPHEESKQLLAELFEFLESPELLHEQRWTRGDLMLWDNRTLIHRSSGKFGGKPSTNYRVGIYDGLEFYKGCKLEETALHV